MGLIEIIQFFGGIIVAYLLGSIPSAVWLGKAFFQVDVRTMGSKNAGATNTIRVLGLMPGLIVLFLDVMKGWVAVYCGNFFGGFFTDHWGMEIGEMYCSYYKLLLGCVAVLGHIFPIFVSFRGGKGVATIVGVLIGLFWAIFPFVIGIFVLTFMCFQYISLASIVSALCFPLIYLCSGPWLHYEVYPPLLIFTCLVAIFIPITHRKNIVRLWKGEEPKFRIHKRPQI